MTTDTEPTGSRLRGNFSPDEIERRVEAATSRRAFIQSLFDNAMRSGTDYGKVGQMSKPALHQPGAELLLAEFHLTAKSVRVAATEDIEADFFSYSYLAEIWDGDSLIASREGVCNSDESHYRNQKARRLYRQMRASGSIPEKTEGEKSVYGAGEGAETYAQMAQKRAMVAATLVACDAHFLFTLDDDMESVSSSMKGGGGRSCPAHPGKSFFKKGNMRGYAHPTDNDGPWCNEVDVIANCQTEARAAIAQLIPLKRGQNQAPWAEWVKSTFPNMPGPDDRTAADWVDIAKTADSQFDTDGAIEAGMSQAEADDAPPVDAEDLSWGDVDNANMTGEEVEEFADREMEGEQTHAY